MTTSRTSPPDADVGVARAADLVDEIRALEEQVARAQAEQARLTAELSRLRPDDVAGLVSWARRLSPARATRQIGLARALTAELPATYAAMRAGRLSEWRATLIARETACLAPHDREAVDAEVCEPDPDGTLPCEGWGDRRIVAEVRRMVGALDPRAVVDRRSRAEGERRVTLRAAPDTMAQLSSLLPAAQGVAVWGTLSRAADQARATGDPRSRGQIMADTLVERVTGQAVAAAVPVQIHLVVSDQTLLDGGGEPALIQDYGPVTAATARELASTAAKQAQAALRRLYARPATGALVAMDSRSRTFPLGLARLIELRDRTCRTPWCDAPIRHRDHVVDSAGGGATSETNGQGLCEQCNYLKQQAGWRSRPITGPPGSAHTVETRLPTGHTMTSTAPRAPTPATRQPVSRYERYLSDVVLEYAA